MAGYTNYSGVYLSTSDAYTRQLWATGRDALYAPNTPTQLMGSNEGNFLQGGSADDTIYVINTGDRVSGGGGVDTVYATVDFTLPADVENLTMDARWSPVLGVGNNSANILKAVTANVTLEGMGGDDVIISAGGDTFKFGVGSGKDTLIDFHTDSDVVRLSGYNLSSFSDVKAAMTQVGADTLLKLSSNDLVLFKNTHVSDFTAKNFQLTINPGTLKTTFADEFDSLKLQQQGHADGWSAAYAWDRYDSHSAHTIFGESEVYVDPTFKGTSGSALGLNPFSIDNGVLSISAQKTPDWARASLWNHDFTSGVLTTQGAFSQTYGYFEMRADLPSGKGAFPAFWLLSDDDQYNEIDVVETVNGEDKVWNHIHYQNGGADRAGVGFSSTTPNLSDGFHTFGLLWSPEKLTWYVDGAEVASTATPAAMNKPMYMLVNYAVGGSWAGAPDGASLTDMKVDYVRAYSLENSPVSGGGPAPAPAPAAPAPAPAAPAPAPAPSMATLTATGGADVLNLSATQAQAIVGFDPAHDKLGVTIGAGGFNLTGGALKMVDAAAWWNNISGASVIRWVGQTDAMDSAADVDGMLQSMPGHQGEGAFVLGYTGGDKVALYYDASPGQSGGARLVATFDNLTNTRQLSLDDFQAAGSAGAPAAPAPAPSGAAQTGSLQTGAVQTGGSGADVFDLAPGKTVQISGFDHATDAFRLPGDLSLSGAQGGMVDVEAWWNRISGNSIVRWTGDARVMDSAADVDAVLASMPGNGGAKLIVAYTADHQVGIYYDSDSAHDGGVTLLAKVANITDTHAITSSDFLFA